MACGCTGRDDRRGYVRAESRAIGGVSDRWATLLQVRPESGTRHLLMDSPDATVLWRVVSYVDGIEVVTTYRSEPLAPQHARVPPGGARVDYWVISIASTHQDPISPGGDPAPRVIVAATDADSSLESLPYVPPPAPALLPGPAGLAASGALILVSHRVTFNGSSGSWSINWNTVPPGTYRVRSLFLGTEIPGLDALAFELFSASTQHPASVYVPAELRSVGGHSCWVGTAGPLDMLVAVTGSSVPSNGLRGRLMVEAGETPGTGLIDVSVLVESYVPDLSVATGTATFVPAS